MRKANPVAVALGLQQGPKVTYGPSGGATKPRPSAVKAKTRARNRRARQARRRGR